MGRETGADRTHFLALGHENSLLIIRCPWQLILTVFSKAVTSESISFLSGEIAFMYQTIDTI